MILLSEHDDDSLPTMNLNGKTATIIGISLLSVFVIGFVIGIFLLGFAGLFKLLGVQYQSVWSLVIFVVSFFILGVIFDVFFDAMAKLSMENISGNANIFLVQMLFGFASNLLVLSIVDALMKSITLSLETKLIIAFLLSLLEPIFANKK